MSMLRIHVAEEIMSDSAKAAGFLVCCFLLAFAASAIGARDTDAAQAEQEDTRFCEGIDRGPGRDGFNACVASLRDVRKREAERITARTAGIL